MSVRACGVVALWVRRRSMTEDSAGWSLAVQQRAGSDAIAAGTEDGNSEETVC